MIRSTILFYLVAFSALSVFAQTDSALIRFKQRVLSKKTESGDGAAVDSLRTLHLMITGSIYQTEKHVNYCYDETTHKYNFREELKYIQPLLSLGDITLANLKTSFGGDIKNMYSSPDEFALALKYSGINALVHANLHTANVSRETFVRTRNLMNEFDIWYTGAFTDNYQRNGNYPLIIDKKGFKIAVLNYGTLNKRPPISRNFYINEIDKDQIGRDMRMVRAYKPDFTIVYFDWGANMQETPSYYQMEIAQYCYQNGANLIVGTHPNAPMKIDFVNYSDKGTMKEGIVAYSLGNLIASNDEVRNRNGYILDIELKKNNYTGDVNLGDWGVIPVYTYYDTSSAPGKMNIYTVPSASVESGDILPKIPYIEKRRVVNSAYEVRKLLGSVADEIQYNENELVANNVMEVIDLTNAAWNNKYSQKRKEEIAASDPPVLPVATVGTNNPPSLASIYEEPVKKPTPKMVPIAETPVIASASSSASKNNRIEAERAKAEGALSGKSYPSNPVAPVDFNSGSNANTANNTATGVGNENIPTVTRVESEGGGKNVGLAMGTVNSNPAAKSSSANTASNTETVAGSTASKTNAVANETADAENAAKIKAEKTIAADEDAANRKRISDAEEAERKKRQAYEAEEAKKKAAAPRANYHEPNDYDLNDPARNTATKKTTVPAPERPDETAVKAPTQKTDGISTQVRSEANPELTPVKGKTLKMVMDTFYRIQFYALKKYLPLDTNYYTHLKGYEVVEENGYFKYLLGRYKNYEDCLRFWKNQIQPRYKESFIVKYIDGRRVLD